MSKFIPGKDKSVDKEKRIIIIDHEKCWEYFKSNLLDKEEQILQFHNVFNFTIS